ncbi:MAG: hypothetical protein Terrestrivirus1_184 [Terrestrivirus sp.]|uniref:Uncharacterized protein n=1 Tax=Terrestrivirus sp. TaxID=2487775 RepID=A0A3G4ZKF2_9VIRU|nr:MAG: hypothetical protein Terrestrivirus1_184 [Terrestrivirus sp.]
MTSQTTTATTTVKKYISGFFIEEPATNILVPNSVAQNNILNACKQLQTTDIYMYLITKDITNNTANLQNFISELSSMGINLWALNGDRSMFLDPNCDGYSELTNEIQAIATYNSNCAANQKIHGLLTDMELQDVTYGTGSSAISYVGFHNGLATNQLSNTFGSGIYYNTQVEDREMLVKNLVQIHAKLKTLTSAAGIKLSMCLTNWTENYYGQSIQCQYNGIYENVFYHLCTFMDQIVIMSYKSSQTNLISCVTQQLAYTDKLPNPPLICACYDVVQGDGITVSIADLGALYNTKTYAATFSNNIASALSMAHTSYAGLICYTIEGLLTMPS